MGQTLESGTNLNAFDVVAFSVAFELDYLHILQILEKARIPLFASRRTPRDPLIVIGGVAVSVNRHPIYPFADVLAHGDGEELVRPLFQAIEELREDRKALARTAWRDEGGGNRLWGLFAQLEAIHRRIWRWRFCRMDWMSRLRREQWSRG